MSQEEIDTESYIPDREARRILPSAFSGLEAQATEKHYEP